MKVVICEQDFQRAKSMKAILGHYSYKVVTVQKNTDLFNQVLSTKPAVIIVNESFNDNLSIDTINRLKNDPQTSSIPLIFISNGENIKSVVEANHKHMEVIQEPVRIKNLRHYIDRWTTFRTLYNKH